MFNNDFLSINNIKFGIKLKILRIFKSQYFSLNTIYLYNCNFYKFFMDKKMFAGSRSIIYVNTIVIVFIFTTF